MIVQQPKDTQVNNEFNYRPVKKVNKFRVLKNSFNSISLEGVDYTYLDDIIMRANQLNIYCCQFLRLFVLYKIKEKEEVPIIDTDVIRMAYKTLMIDSSGPKPKGKNLKTYTKFEKFFEKEKFIKLMKPKKKLDGAHLSSILSYNATTILTNIENNIKMHFFDHLRKFVNQVFKKEIDDELNNFKGKEYLAKKKELNSELGVVKRDLENNTRLCDKKYHKWIDEYRNKILPKEFEDSYKLDIDCNPQKYLKYMVEMINMLEKDNLKLFQFFPLRSNIVPKYVSLDTKALVEIFIREDKNEYLDNIEKYKDDIWPRFFKMDDKFFKMNKYTFNYTLLTNGHAISACFIHNSFVEKSKSDKQNRLKDRRILKELCKGKSSEEEEQIRANRQIEKKEEKDKKKLEYKKQNDKKKENFKKLHKEEQDRIKEEIKRSKHVEFPYLDELTKKQKEELLIKKKVYIDPGKRSLFYMIDDDGLIFNYTNKTRIRETKRLKYNKLVQNFKKKKKIEEIEATLSDYNSKTCNYEQFKKYIKKKNEINEKLFGSYRETFFRKLQWFSFINTKRSESNLLNTVEKIYGKDIVIIIGDWSIGKQMRNFISTPNIRLKRLLAERFPVYNFDEFRTSCLHHETEKKVDNLYLPDKKGKSRKIHAILTYIMENQRYGCINRDINGVSNIRKLALEYLKFGSRSHNYKRTTKPEDMIPIQKVVATKHTSNGYPSTIDVSIVLSAKSIKKTNLSLCFT